MNHYHIRVSYITKKGAPFTSHFWLHAENPQAASALAIPRVRGYKTYGSGLNLHIFLAGPGGSEQDDLRIFPDERGAEPADLYLVFLTADDIEFLAGNDYLPGLIDEWFRLVVDPNNTDRAALADLRTRCAELRTKLKEAT